MMSARVALCRCAITDAPAYPEFPFAPSGAYPEFPASGGKPSSHQNAAFAAVRQCLAVMGLDGSRFGTAQWNPLADLIEPGQQVLIKPNWVRHESTAGGAFEALVTHSSVIRAILDYVLLALRGSGRVIIGDAPIQSADFDSLVERTAIARLIEQVDAGPVDIELRDFRENVCRQDDRGRVTGHRKLQGDRDGYAVVDLGAASALEAVSDRSERFRVTNYDPSEMLQHHAPGRHEYLVARAILRSDVVINVPKLKTHRKAGLTCCLKNLVGINGSKDYLPHHRVGPLEQGGDEYARPCIWKALASRMLDVVESPGGALKHGAARLALRVARRMARHAAPDPYSEGSWHGNDTVWRMVLDLNRILLTARDDGSLADSPQRRVLHVVDGIVAGEGEGPLIPEARRAGIVLAGYEAAAVDAMAARLIGFDPDKLPLLRGALAWRREALGQSGPQLVTCMDETPKPLGSVAPLLCVKPSAGWAGHVELDTCPVGLRDAAEVTASKAEE